MYCPKCKAYVPKESDKCVACGQKIERAESDGLNDTVLIYRGKKIPVYVEKTEWRIIEPENMFYDSNGRLTIQRQKIIHRYTVVEKEAM